MARAFHSVSLPVEPVVGEISVHPDAGEVGQRVSHSLPSPVSPRGCFTQSTNMKDWVDCAMTAQARIRSQDQRFEVQRVIFRLFFLVCLSSFAYSRLFVFLVYLFSFICLFILVCLSIFIYLFLFVYFRLFSPFVYPRLHILVCLSSFICLFLFVFHLFIPVCLSSFICLFVYSRLFVFVRLLILVRLFPLVYFRLLILACVSSFGYSGPDSNPGPQI